MPVRSPCPLILRADAGPGIGLGHLMRTIAIGQKWQDHGGEVTVVTALPGPATDKRLRSEGFTVKLIAGPPGSEHDATETARIAASLHAGWVVVDGYVFGGSYQKALKDRGCKVLFIDDYGHAEYYSADIVLNQNLSAQEEMYTHRDPGTRLLLGPRYAMIRREFVQARHPVRETPEMAGRLLVSLGGADPENVTLTVIRALEALGQSAPHAMVVVGEANPHGDDIASAVEALPEHTLARGGADMAALMSSADAAVSGGGSTTCELLFMGVPFLTLILAENQAAVARALESRGLAWNLGEGRDLSDKNLVAVLRKFLGSRKIRADLSERGRHLVDGCGTARIVMHLRGDPFWLRKAEERDCEQVLKWANDPVVRSASFNPAPIPPKDHHRWFSGRLSDPRCHMFIAYDVEDRPAGLVRFELLGDEAEVHYNLDRGQRGKGLGTPLLCAGLEALKRKNPVRLVKGIVKADNLPSIRSFERAGFSRKDMGMREEYDVIEFVLEI